MLLGPLSYSHEIDEKRRAAIDAHALAASPELENEKLGETEYTSLMAYEMEP
jgi:hypothetical protein